MQGVNTEVTNILNSEAHSSICICWMTCSKCGHKSHFSYIWQRTFCLIALFLLPYCITWPAGVWHGQWVSMTNCSKCRCHSIQMVWALLSQCHKIRIHNWLQKEPLLDKPGRLFTKRRSYRKISWNLEAARFGFRFSNGSGSAAEMPV